MNQIFLNKQVNLLSHFASVLALTGALVVLTGCSDGNPPRVSVAGTVLVDGQPLTKGSITFVPVGGRPSRGTIGQDGRFELACFHDDDGALLGEHRVSVISRTINGSKVQRHAPSRYANHHTSGIKVEITEPVDDLVIELTSKDDKKRR